MSSEADELFTKAMKRGEWKPDEYKRFQSLIREGNRQTPHPPFPPRLNMFDGEVRLIPAVR